MLPNRPRSSGAKDSACQNAAWADHPMIPRGPTRRRSCATRGGKGRKTPLVRRRCSVLPVGGLDVEVRFPRRRHHRRREEDTVIGHRVVHLSRSPCATRVPRCGATSRLQTGCPAARGVYSRVTSEAVSAMLPLRAWQRRALTSSTSPKSRGTSRRRHARRRENGLRPAYRRGAVGRSDGRGDHRRRAHRTPQAPVGGCGGAGWGLRLTRTTPPDGATGPDYNGVVVTCAGRVASPRHRVRTENRKTLVILDEVHHAGDAKSWGDAINEAFSTRHGVFRSPVRRFPVRRFADPVRHLRARARRGARVQGGPRLRVLRRTGRRRRPTGGVPGVLGPGQLADQRR